MQLNHLLFLLLSLLNPSTALSRRLPAAKKHNLGDESPHTLSLIHKPVHSTSNLSSINWPPVPWRVPLPKRRHQFLLITENDRKDHGRQARQLAIRVCTQMVDWLLELPAQSPIKVNHWEHHSYGTHFAVEYSIFLSLIPAKPHDAPNFGFLDREMAYLAMDEFRNLVDVHGAMHGEFELHILGLLRMTARMHVFEWPPDTRTE